MKLTIGHLYPDLLNLYGDRGNIQCMMKRLQWRGIEAETIEFEIQDEVDFSELDIVLLGGGSDREQMLVCERDVERNPSIDSKLMWRTAVLSLQSAADTSYSGPTIPLIKV